MSASLRLTITMREPRFRLAVWTGTLAAALLAWGPLAAQAAADVAQAPLVWLGEIGASYASFSDGLGDANGQFVRLLLGREARYEWRFEVGRDARFGESSLGLGAAYTRYLRDGTSFMLGYATGTGDYLAPRYRIDAAVGRPILDVIWTLGYTRIQSKFENSSDGYTASFARYFSHWLVDGFARYEIGHPGSTESLTFGVGLTYFIWRQTYIGAAVEAGDISYLVVGPEDVFVDFDSTGGNVTVSQWLNARSGINLRLDYDDTSFYRVGGVTVSYFREW